MLHASLLICSKTCLEWPLKKKDKTKILMTNGSLMEVKSIAECSPWSILQCFSPALAIIGLENHFGLLFEWPLKTDFTVVINKVSVVLPAIL